MFDKASFSCAAISAAGQGDTKAEATDSRFIVCRHERAKDESLVSTEQPCKKKWWWPTITSMAKSSFWQVIPIHARTSRFPRLLEEGACTLIRRFRVWGTANCC